MSRLMFVLILGIALVGTPIAFGGNTYAPSTFNKGMTALGTYTVIYPPAVNYNKTTFAKGMTLITPETVVWRGTSGLVVNQSWNVNIGFPFQFYGQTFTTATIAEAIAASISCLGGPPDGKGIGDAKSIRAMT